MHVKAVSWMVTAATAMGVIPAQEVVLHNFNLGSQGAGPTAALIADATGFLYGTTYYGDKAAGGVVYRIDLLGHETVLYRFSGGADGGNPYAGVIRDAAGNLYGTTFYGGNANTGVVYKVDPSGHETVLYSFTGGADGRYPYGGVVQDASGNLYGTTYTGGANGSGVVYKVDTSGNETVMHDFGGVNDGIWPFAGVILDASGNLYGTARNGGTGFGGIVYKLDSQGNETVLHNFSGGGVDGFGPQSGVILDAAGNLYGTTAYGGTSSGNGGTVYKIDPTGVETLLYSFTGGSDGAHPNGGVVLDAAGNLYGTTLAGGAANQGVVFKVDPTGAETVLYNFTGLADGGVPYAGLLLDRAERLLGTTYEGGGANAGLVFKLRP